MNTKELGRWRKLWTKPSPSWEMLPALTRGLGDEMLRYCDDAGRFPLGGLDALTAVCRMLRAHPRERRSIEEHLGRLMDDGFCRVIDDTLVIRNFVAAQQGVTESGERMRALRERQRDAETTPARRQHDADTTHRQQSVSATHRNDSVPLRHSDASREEISGEKKNSPNPLPGGFPEFRPRETNPERPPADPTEAPPRCPAREFLGTDPAEVALALGAVVPRLRHFPGGLRPDFRQAIASLGEVDWSALAAWLAAGGTRRHRTERVTWRWLLGQGGSPLAECLATAREWASKGRPPLDKNGEPIDPSRRPPEPPGPPSGPRVDRYRTGAIERLAASGPGVSPEEQAAILRRSRLRAGVAAVGAGAAVGHA